MRYTESTMFKFDELSERAKERARNWFREGLDFNDECAESVIEDVARLADIIGINLRSKTVRLVGGGTRQEPEVYYSGFYSQGDGASYRGSYGYQKGSVAKLASEAPTGQGREFDGNNEVNRIVRELAAIQKENFYQVRASIGTSSRGSWLDIDVERADGKAMTPDTEENTRQLLRDFADWIYRQLEREYEYRMSDEVVDEDIKANEYEFDEEGNRA